MGWRRDALFHVEKENEAQLLLRKQQPQRPHKLRTKNPPPRDSPDYLVVIPIRKIGVFGGSRACNLTDKRVTVTLD